MTTQPQPPITKRAPRRGSLAGKGPRSTASKTPAPAPAHDYAIGDRVQYAANGVWYPGEVIALAKTNITVRYTKGSGHVYEASVNPAKEWQSGGAMGELPSRVRPAAEATPLEPATPAPVAADPAEAPSAPADPPAPPSDDVRSYLGGVVRAAREAAGLTQAGLAEKMATSAGAVARLEAGGTNPTATTLANVAQALGATLEVALRLP